MPPKQKVTKEMILTSAFELLQNEGIENVNARSVSKHLGCSTQPVMYYFENMDELKAELYRKADDFHTEYIMKFTSDEPMLDMGLNYIRFGAEEKNLFKFLFQSDKFSGMNIGELIEGEELRPIFQMLSQGAEVSIDDAKVIFKMLSMYVHGMASMLANNALQYNEDEVKQGLERLFDGAVYSVKGE